MLEPESSDGKTLGFFQYKRQPLKDLKLLNTRYQEWKVNENLGLDIYLVVDSTLFLEFC